MMKDLLVYCTRYYFKVNRKENKSINNIKILIINIIILKKVDLCRELSDVIIVELIFLFKWSLYSSESYIFYI